MSADKYPSIFSRQMKAIVYILHKSRSNEYDIDFSSEIYCGILQLADECFLNRMSFKRK